MSRKHAIGIIGCGNMGEAIIRQNASFLMFDKNSRTMKRLKKNYGLRAASSISDLAEHTRTILIAVKPQDIDAVLTELGGYIHAKLFISIAAGITTRYIEKRLGGKPRVVRIMPNIAAQVKSALCAVCAGRYARKADFDTAKKIFTTIGKTIRLKEAQMDSFTAIAGSGPAYFFYFIESLSAAGEKMGFSKSQAKEFAETVATGSIRLLTETGSSATRLREKVASKKGTTEAALNVFETARLHKTVEKAVRKAAERARELSKS